MNVEFIGQSVEFIGSYGDAANIESAARVCTQTEVGDDPEGFVRNLNERNEPSPTEFGYIDTLIEVDRGVQQEITRHRHLSFNIESTRWCDYRKKPLRYVTKPPEGMDIPDMCIESLEEYCALGARLYESWLNAGVPRDYARKFFTLALASRMRVGGDIRAWVEMLPKRLSRRVHAETREVARRWLVMFKERFAGIFDHIKES